MDYGSNKVKKYVINFERIRLNKPEELKVKTESL